jgi:hypothetical protein
MEDVVQVALGAVLETFGLGLAQPKESAETKIKVMCDVFM